MNKKILNFGLTLIVILIVIIFGAVYYVVTNNTATNSIYDDVIAEASTNDNSTIKDELEEDDSNSTIELDNIETLKLYPFTGAFPGIDIIPFIAEKEDITNFSNEQILRLGFAKVTKEDWADTYVAEDQPVSIPATLLDGYIKDVFGQNVQYQKENFLNTSYTIDKDFKCHTSSYEAIYIPETDSYTVYHTPGDGINENYVSILEPRVSKIKDNLEIEVPYIYVVYGDEMAKGEIDGEEVEGFEYIIYANLDYETKTFSEELGRFTEFDNFDDDEDENDETDFEDMIEKIVTKNLSKVNKIRLIYSNNEDNTELVLKEIRTSPALQS